VKRPKLGLVRRPDQDIPRVVAAWQVAGMGYVGVELWTEANWARLADVERPDSYTFLPEIGCYIALQAIDSGQAEELARIGHESRDRWERQQRIARRRRREQAPA
jgi:hypothetical protein